MGIMQRYKLYELNKTVEDKLGLYLKSWRAAYQLGNFQLADMNKNAIKGLIITRGYYEEGSTYGLMMEGVDEEIRDLVNLLNAGGYKTVASCSGHGKMMGNIALKDGRELMIIEDYEKARSIEKILIKEGLYEPLNRG